MAHIPPFERGPLSDDPDEIATLQQETEDFLQASDEQVATDVVAHQRDQLERKFFQAAVRSKLTSDPEANIVDEIRADKDNVFADELLLAISHDLPAFLHERDKR